jgi:hypothetical protein
LTSGNVEKDVLKGFSPKTLEQILGRPMLNQLPSTQKQHVVADKLHLPHIMTGEKNGGAAFLTI